MNHNSFNNSKTNVSSTTKSLAFEQRDKTFIPTKPMKTYYANAQIFSTWAPRRFPQRIEKVDKITDEE